MTLLNALDKLAGYFHPHVNAACLTAKEIAELRLAARVAYPQQPDWHVLKYPGESTLPISLLPVPPLMSPEAHTVTTALHQDILREGYPHSQFQICSRYESRMAHFWIAELSRNQFLPIGQATFVLEDRAFKESEDAAGSADSGGLRLDSGRPARVVQRWWMHLAWLRPAYRCQFIFRHTVPYFESCHPDFLVRDPNPPLARSLKDFPQHIFDGRVQWWDGMS